MAGVKRVVCSDEQEVIDKLCKVIEKTANESIEKDNVFKIGLSGGSLVKFLCLGLPSITTDWAKWKIFFCDERLVPFSNSESTFGCYKRDLLPCVPLTENQFIVIDADLNVQSAADDYFQKLKKYFPEGDFPRFDLLLLGTGPDGHTCSLFPGHKLLLENQKWVAAIDDSPKPPPCRITLTFPVLNNSKCVAFVATGAGKAAIIKEVFEGNDQLPAAMVHPHTGILHWILDTEAARYL